MKNLNTLPKVDFDPGDLNGPEGISFSILDRWAQAAKRAGWVKPNIERVIKEAMASDYGHLLATIKQYCKE